ncbi:MAG: patatin-like phospholipase family protein [Sandaracinaceae bacterium]
MTSDGTAIVLSGGGARGAYEAGVVAGIVDVLGPRDRAPFSIFTGTSVGAINAAWLAAHADQGDMDIEGLLRHWAELRLDEHLAVDPMRFLLGPSLGRRLAAWRRRAGHADDDPERWGRSFLDPTALETLVETAIPYERLHHNIRRGVVDALVVAALEISTARTSMFAELAPGATFSPSRDPRRLARPTVIESKHVLASAAIPLLFPARRIGDHYYADGGVRFNTPISPAIRCGANKLVVISLLHEAAKGAEEYSEEAEHNERAYPSPVFLLGKVLNALLLDPVRYDLNVLARFNALLSTLEDTLEPSEMARVKEVLTKSRGVPYRQLETLVFEPSEDIGALAHEHARKTARSSVSSLLVRRLADLGEDFEADLLSFILFDGEFAASLAELGRNDAVSRADEIQAFFGGNQD